VSTYIKGRMVRPTVTTAYLLFYLLSSFLKKKENYAVEAESIMECRWTHAAGIISLPATAGPLFPFDCGSYVNVPKSSTYI
jgi:hypothetical protein